MKKLFFAVFLLLTSFAGKAQFYDATQINVLGSVTDNMYVQFTGANPGMCAPVVFTPFYGPIFYGPSVPPTYRNVAGSSWSGPTPDHFFTISIAHQMPGGALEYAAPISICSATYPISVTLTYPSSYSVMVQVATTSVPGELAVFIL